MPEMSQQEYVVVVLDSRLVSLSSVQTLLDGLVMTTPRDAIAGLLDDIKNRRLHHAYPYHLDDLLDEAATQLDSLLKERDAPQARVSALQQNDDAMATQIKTLIGQKTKWMDRALRAEQERDGANERCRILLEAKNYWMERACKAEGK